MSFNPFDLTGGPFLQLYGGLFLLAFVMGIVIPRWLRPDGQQTIPRDRDLVAYLAGGKTRLAESVVASLLERGAMAIDGRLFKMQTAPAGTSASEREVLALVTPTNWSGVAKAATANARHIDARLVQMELLVSHGEAMQMRLFQTLPYLLLFAFGVIKWQVGVARDKPVGFLTILLVVTLVLALLRFAILDRKTRAGQDALREAKKNTERLSRAPTGEETGLAVALFGTTVLAGSALSDFHRLRMQSGNSDGGSTGDSGGSSGCGGGGGGCGGCGS